jgi:hypothetical protein
VGCVEEDRCKESQYETSGRQKGGSQEDIGG